MFVIDDGSTDGTKEVVAGYSEKFRRRGLSFHYVYQENQGQSTAINCGLKLISGDYLIWPDADDWYAESDALEIMAASLADTTDDVGCCHCLSSYIDERNLEITHKNPARPTAEADLFEDCLFDANGFVWGAGNYMLKTHVGLNETNGRSIFTAKDAAQNSQLLLPVLYEKKCVIINKYLFNILQRVASHSRKKLAFEKEFSKYNAYHNAVINTLDSMEMLAIKRERYKREIDTKYNDLKLRICFAHGKTKDYRNLYKQMAGMESSPCKKRKRLYYLSYVPCGWIVHKTMGAYYKRATNVLRRCIGKFRKFFA